MYYYPYPYVPYAYPYRAHPYYPQEPYPAYHTYHSDYALQAPYMEMDRQQPVRGEATWTEGGPVTKCGIPWSNNQYMTVAVGENSPYECGQTLKIRNLSNPGTRDVIVTVVDEVRGYPQNKINLHRRAFEALGADTNVGVINVEIIPSPEVEEERWGKYLLNVTQSAYPNYNVTDYQSVHKNEISENQTREVYEFTLENQQETISIQGTVTYNPNNNRVLSFDIQEI